MFSSVRARILLLAGLPLLVALWFMLSAIIERYQVVQELDTMEPLTQLGIHIGGLVHETQKERGASGIFLGSQGSRFKSELSSQRSLTNHQRAAPEQYLDQLDTGSYGEKFKAKLTRAKTLLRGLNTLRNSVDAMDIATGQALKKYTEHNEVMLGLVQQIVELGVNAEIAQLRSAYLNFMQGKERAGIQA